MPSENNDDTSKIIQVSQFGENVKNQQSTLPLGDADSQAENVVPETVDLPESLFTNATHSL